MRQKNNLKTHFYPPSSFIDFYWYKNKDDFVIKLFYHKKGAFLYMLKVFIQQRVQNFVVITYDFIKNHMPFSDGEFVGIHILKVLASKQSGNY